MELGPMEILYCWQSVLLSCGVHVGTRALKGAVLLSAGDSKKRLAWAKQFFIPLIPLLLGMFSAVVFPLHPDALVKYIKADGIADPMMVYACYGGAVGTFADYIHQRISGAMEIKSAHSDAADTTPSTPASPGQTEPPK